jgi:hypothetical protein
MAITLFSLAVLVFLYSLILSQWSFYKVADHSFSRRPNKNRIKLPTPKSTLFQI